MEFNSVSIQGVSVLVFRDDLNHATVSGNKLHKLQPNIEQAIQLQCSTILSFGGAYSNHLHALAWAAKEAKLASVGIVRGELHSCLTPTLNDCQEWGMQLLPCPRKDYRMYRDALMSQDGQTRGDQPLLASEIDLPVFSGQPNRTLVIPEGGSNIRAIRSVAAAYANVFQTNQCENVTHAVCATGTGATLAGLHLAAPNSVRVIGVQAVAEGEATMQRISDWINSEPEQLSIRQAHLGGFGKTTIELKEFIEKFESEQGIPLDPIYNAKAMFELYKMIDAGYFSKTDKVLFVNTGGLHGKRKAKRI